MKRTNFIVSLFLIFLMAFMVALFDSDPFTYSNSKAFAEDAKHPEEQKPLYHAGSWRGRVIDADTKQPIEGTVVAAIWYREYDTRLTIFKDFHEAKEVLTDKDGYFEIPAYTETGETKDSWRKPQLPGTEGPIEFFVIGPVIKEPEFIIYKPTFNYYPAKVESIIFAIGPSVVEYQEVYTEKISGKEVTYLRKSTKNFPEGLVYAGAGCLPVMEKLEKKANFRFDSVFLQMDNAREKIKKLDIPMDCPKKAEPIPISLPGYKYDIESPLKKGGYVVIGLSKPASQEEQLKAIPKEPVDVSPDKLPILFRLIKEEKEKIKIPEEPKGLKR